MDIITVVISFASALLVAIVSFYGTVKQTNAMMENTMRQVEVSLEIAKLNIKGRVILEQKQKWLADLSIDLSELLSKAQSIKDIVRVVSENKETTNEAEREIISEKIERYWEISERVSFLADKIGLNLDVDIDYHKDLYDGIYNLLSSASEVDFEKPNYEVVRMLNQKCFRVAKTFIKKEKEELLKEV